MEGTFRRELECTLTSEQTRTYSGELARLTQSQAELEDKKKEVTADYKAKIDACISQSRVIARKVSSGKEMRDVECRWDYIWNENIKYLIRLDTFEIIDSKVITEDEKQRHFEFEKKNQIESEPEVATPEEELQTIEEIAGTTHDLIIIDEVSFVPPGFGAIDDDSFPDLPGTDKSTTGLCVLHAEDVPCVDCGNCAVDGLPTELTEDIPPAEEPAFECQDCAKKKKKRICGDDCRKKVNNEA